jgi:hypothetical protein
MSKSNLFNLVLAWEAYMKKKKIFFVSKIDPWAKNTMKKWPKVDFQKFHKKKNFFSKSILMLSVGK